MKRQLGLLAILLGILIKEAHSQGLIPKQPLYAVVAPTKIRPNQKLTVAATVMRFDLFDSFTVRAVVRYLVSEKVSEEICSAEHAFARPGTHNLVLQTPSLMRAGNYTIRVSGFSDAALQGLIFVNETRLEFDSKQISLFIQTNKPYYNQRQTVLIRLIPLYPNSMPVTTTMDVNIKDNNGITVRSWDSLHTNAGGVVTLKFPLNSNFLAYGKWSINVNCLGHAYSKTFVVYEFYPPIFFVNVSVPTYMFRHSYELPVMITSTQGTLKPIKGNATVQLEVLDFDGKKIDDIAPIKRSLPYFEHQAVVAFNTEELQAHVGGGENGLIGKQLKATVWVQDWHFNTTASGYAATLVYSEQIQLNFLGGQVWSFKPNIPFKIYVAAQRLDKSAIDPYIEDRGIEISVTTTDANTGENTITELVPIPKDTSVVEYWLYPTDRTEQFVVRAIVPGELATEKVLVATKYWSPTNQYLHISTNTARPTVDNYIIFALQSNVFVDIVYYYIVSKGNIMASDSIQMYSKSKLFSVAVSREMSPSATIVAFFVSPAGQVAADSLQFHVDHTRLHNMRAKFNRGKDFSYDTIEITAWADPLSYVAFSALEYQMYHLGIRNGLTWDQVNQELYTYNNHTNTSITHYFKKDGQTVDTFTAATPSYAHDANSTFFYSGLYIFTDANVSSVYTACNMSKGEYPCMDGLSCYNYQQVCNMATTCTRDHRDEMGCHRNESESAVLYETGGWDRTKHIGAFYRDGAFMWTDQFTKPDGRIDIKIKPPSFESSWVMSGFSLSRENGLAILPGLHIMNSGRLMYINVAGVSTMRLGEILTLRITVFNSWTEELDVLLTIKGSKDYQCVEVNGDDATPVDGEHHVMVAVYPNSVRQIYVPIQPSQTGTIAIPIRAMSFIAGHSVTHKVSVGYNAIPDRNITNYQVDLRIANSKVLPDLWITVEEFPEVFEQRFTHYVAGSPRSYVSVIGDIVGISFFPSTNYNLQTGNVIAQPSGCGAEALFNVEVNVITLSMLRSLGSIDSDKIAKVADHINLGIQEMFAYLNTEGSFKEFDWSSRGSTWVSATALKVMTSGVKARELSSYFEIPREPMNRTANWLLTKQDKMGRFTENDVVHNRRFESKLELSSDNGTAIPANIALTALCLTALAQASTATSLSNAVIEGIQLSTGYLDTYYRDITDPFEMAIASYAMFVSGASREKYNALYKLGLMKRTVKDMIYWSTEEVPAIVQASYQDRVLRIEPKSTGAATAYTVSATSYALLAYMRSSQHQNAKEVLDPVQRFLQEQHMWVGGFSSSQDTLVALHALTELAGRDQSRASYDMTFTFKSDQDPDWVKTIHLNKDNWFDLQRFETPSHWGTIQAVAKGHGLALVQMETIQNFENTHQLAAAPIPDIFDLGNFNFNIKTKGFNHSWIDYRICPRWNGESEKCGMSVLEVSLPTGYKPSTWGLQGFVAKKNKTTAIRSAEFNGKDGIVVFYFEYLNKSRLNCAEFRAYRWFPTAHTADMTGIKVYEYYEPGNYFGSAYEKVELSKLTVCLVCGSYQCPYCPNYNSGHSLMTSNCALLLPLLTTMFLSRRILNHFCLFTL